MSLIGVAARSGGCRACIRFRKGSPMTAGFPLSELAEQKTQTNPGNHSKYLELRPVLVPNVASAISESPRRAPPPAASERTLSPAAPSTARPATARRDALLLWPRLDHHP